MLHPAAVAGFPLGHASHPSAGWRSLPSLVSWSLMGSYTFEAKNAEGLQSNVTALPTFQHGPFVSSCLTDLEALIPWFRVLLL